MILDESNFNEALKDFEYLFVNFYGPNCSYCTEMMPEWYEAARKLSKRSEV
jgi:thiol-disulfide isomerase/thioredoxin